MTIETRKVCVLSTAHLAPETMKYMDTTPHDQWRWSGGPISYGYYIYAHDEDGNAEGSRIPPDLWAAMAWARAEGFDYIQFDQDADARPELVDYHTPDSPEDALKRRIAAILAEAKAYDEKMCGGPDGEEESRPPEGDDYNELHGWLKQIAGIVGAPF